MSQQKALLVPSKGADFVVGPRPIPAPGRGQILIKNEAAALNPVDQMLQQFGFYAEPYGYPIVPGSDGAGVVEAVGEGVQGWKKGDRVCVCASPFCTSVSHGVYQLVADVPVHIQSLSVLVVA